MNGDEIKALRLHTDETGCVWYGDDLSLGTNSFLEPADFFGHPNLPFVYDRVRAVRLLGSRSNADLITRLQERRVHRGLLGRQQVYLGSPAVCPTRAVRHDPLAVMQYLWQPEMPSSLTRQWHLMSNHDFCTYSMARSYDETGKIDDAILRTATYHPAWKAIQFVNGYDPVSAAHLLIEILDPRWFAHYSRANRLNRLYAHLGLNPYNVAAIVEAGKTKGRHFPRAALAVKTWYSTAAYDSYMSSGHDVPGNFLWRICTSQRNVGVGILRATERLISLICHVWHDAIVAPHPEMGFQPSQFFKTEAEVTAFTEHMRS